MHLIPSNYFDLLKKKYESDANLADYWRAEESDLRNLTEEICKHIAFNYQLIKPLGVGGSGVVSIVQDKNLGVPRALKIARPSPGKEMLLARLLQGEASNLVRLSHPNLIQVFAKGVATTDSKEGSSEFLLGQFIGQFTTRDLIEAITADGIAVPEAQSEIKSLNDVLCGISLHSKFPHISLCKEAEDFIKRESLLISEDRVKLNRLILEAAYPLKCPKKTKDIPYYVMDFVEGAVDSDKYVASPNCKESDFIKLLEGIVSAIAYLHSQGTIHMDIKPGNVLVTPKGVPIVSDLGFAKQLRVDDKFTLIGGTEGYIHPDARRFVEEAHSDPRRLRGHAPHNELKCEWDLYSLGKTFLKYVEEFEKNHAKEWSPYSRRYIRLLSCRLLDGLNKESELALGLPQTTLQEIKYRSIDQAKTDLDKLTGRYNLEVRVPELNLFTQDTVQASTLSTTPFTKRVKAIASLPAFTRLGLCTQLGLLNLIYPTARHTRYEHSLGTFSVLCRFLLSLYNDTLNPLFRQIMDEEDLKAALLVALLHDIGQYPLAHDLEEADHHFFSHEALGLDILRKNLDLKLVVEGPEDWNVPMDRVISILRADPAKMEGSLKDRILHSLIDGPIDADKMDYLMRDSRNLGLTYGLVLDFERLLRCLTIIYREHNKQTYAVLGIHDKGKVTAESVGFARYALFGQVYWHHTYRSVKAMIHRIIWETVSAPGLDRKAMRADFREFLMPDETVLPLVSREDQMTFMVEPKSDKRLSAYHSQADENDLSVLEWFSARSTEAGRELFGLIEKRQLFKRIFVLSKEGGTDKDRALWDSITEFFKVNRRNWQAKLDLQNTFQRKLADYIEQPPADQPLSQPLEPTLRNKFLVEARLKILLLIDIPPDRKASIIPLEYLVEEDRQRFKREEIKTENLEQSSIWRAIQNSFQESLGKLRIFCHPGYADFLSRSIPRIIFETKLAAAIEEENEKADAKAEAEKALAKS